MGGILYYIRKGFTLVELMIVISIIGVLAAALYPQIGKYEGRSRDAGRVTALGEIQPALDSYQFEYDGKYPTHSGGCVPMDMLVAGKYLITPITSPSGTGYNEGCGKNGQFSYGNKDNGYILLSLMESKLTGNYSGSTSGFTGTITETGMVNSIVTKSKSGPIYVRPSNSIISIASYLITASGSCGSTPNTCNDGGTPTGYTAPPACGGNHTWTCQGINGGGDVSCSIPNTPCASCTLPWGGTIAHGANTIAYSSNSALYPTVCSSLSQSRSCNNGVLGGSFTNSGCTNYANISGGFGANAAGASINGCGRSATADASGNFIFSNVAYGTACNNFSITKAGYSCSVSTNGPSSVSATVTNVAGSCTLTVNGACGGANGVATASYPTANWCTTGTKADVDTAGTDGAFNWSCNGSGGGSNVNCSATRNYLITFNGNGGTGHTPTTKTVNHSSTLGTMPTNPTRAGYSFNGWYTATTGGSSVTGTTVITSSGTYYAQWISTVNGACGTANGVATASYPTANWCTTGTKADVDTTGSDGAYNWSCNGSGGGTSVSCSANKQQTFTCAAKPATGTTWNTVSSYLQTWNGAAWSPANSTTVYNTTASTTSCRYTCASGYVWNGTSCVATYTVSGSFGANAAGATITGCSGETATASSTGAFVFTTVNHGTACNNIVATRTNYTCTTSTNGPASITGNVTNVAGSCSAIVNGTCGTANGVATASYPTANWCTTGAKADIDTTGTDGTYNWSCNGSGGGTNVSCSANKTYNYLPTILFPGLFNVYGIAYPGSSVTPSGTQIRTLTYNTPLVNGSSCLGITPLASWHIQPMAWNYTYAPVSTQVALLPGTTFGGTGCLVNATVTWGAYGGQPNAPLDIQPRTCYLMDFTVLSTGNGVFKDLQLNGTSTLGHLVWNTTMVGSADSYWKCVAGP